MLYHLFKYISAHISQNYVDVSPVFSFFRLSQYTTWRTMMALLTALLLLLLFGRKLILQLYRRRLRDTVRDYSVIDAGSKKGTPTMGGVLIVGALGVSALLWCDLTNPMVWYLFLALGWFSFVGGLDDYLKLKHSESDKGLSRAAKYAMQGGFGLVLAILFLHPATTPYVPTELAPDVKSLVSELFVPFYKHSLIDLGWLYALVIIFMLVYSSNAVNFADGLDGLAVMPTLMVFLVYGVYAYVSGNFIFAGHLLLPYLPGAGEVAVFCGAVAGAGLGFLWFNAYPADVFMGDTGSMALGGVLGTTMVLIKQEVLFFLLGGIFLAELMSVVIQDWLGIQLLGRRILYRAPIHHTFQHQGLSEPKIAVRFWIVAGVLALLSLAALKLR